MAHPAESVFVQSRKRLIQAAWEAFMEEGYRASVDRIAARAGVAKQTLYNHFHSKEDLFSEVASIASAQIVVSLDDQGSNLRESLLRFGQAYRTKMLSDDGLAMFRVLVAEVARFPSLAKAFHDKGPRQTVARLSSRIGQSMAAGQLRSDDPDFAAQMLLGMLAGFDRTARIFGEPLPPLAEEQQRTESIIDCFLRAYSPERKKP